MTEPNTLLDAVDALTKPVRTKVIQEIVVVPWLPRATTHTAEHPPLLTQLRDKITPSSNTSAGSASLAHMRNIIDSDAMFEHAKITAAIGDWCRIYDVERTRDPVVDLRRWYIAFTRNPSDSGWHERELRRWAGVIKNILEPAQKFEVLTPCPVCGSDSWVNPEGETIPHPILVTYRLSHDGGMIDEKATCRASSTDDEGFQAPCGATWDSFAAIAELGQELAERHAG